MANSDTKALTCDLIRWEDTKGQLPQAARTAVRAPDFVNLGKRSWMFLEEGRPGANGAWATACPVGFIGAPGPGPVECSGKVSAKNQYGSWVAQVDWKIVVHKAASDDASTLYIARLELAPANVQISYGWKVSMEATVLEALAYDEAGKRLALLPVQAKFILETQVKKQQDSRLYLATPGGVFAA